MTLPNRHINVVPVAPAAPAAPAETSPETARVDKVKVVRAAIALMDDLAQVMREEADLLEKQKFMDQRDLLKRKQRLALEYRATMKSFAAQPDILKDMPDDVRAAVRNGAQRLADLSDRNARSLRAAVVGVQSLLQSIMRIVKSEALAPNGYDNFKTQHLKLGTYSPTCKPVTTARTV